MLRSSIRAHDSKQASYFVSLCTDGQGNEVYGGSDGSVGIFLHRSSDDAVVRGEKTSYQ